MYSSGIIDSRSILRPSRLRQNSSSLEMNASPSATAAPSPRGCGWMSGRSNFPR